MHYSAYPFASVIGDMILLDIGLSQSEVSSFMGTLFMIMSIGTLIPLILLPKGISIKNVVLLSKIQLFLLFISIIFYNSKMISYTLFLIGITFSLCEVSVEKEFEKVSNKKIRGTVISLSMCIMIIMKIFNTMYDKTINVELQLFYIKFFYLLTLIKMNFIVVCQFNDFVFNCGIFKRLIECNLCLFCKKWLYCP